MEHPGKTAVEISVFGEELMEYTCGCIFTLKRVVSQQVDVFYLLLDGEGCYNVCICMCSCMCACVCECVFVCVLIALRIE